MKKLFVAIVVLGLIYSNTSEVNASFGNLLISTDNQIYEYTTQGGYLQSFFFHKEAW